MLVASFVMKPGKRDPAVFPFRVVRTLIALIVAGALQKLGGRVFGKIMGQPLQIKTAAETVAPDQMPVLSNGVEVLPGLLQRDAVFGVWICHSHCPV